MIQFRDDFDPPMLSGIISTNGKEICLGDEIELIFSKGTHSEHRANVMVVWKYGGYCLKHENGNFTLLGRIGQNVEVIK